jgi:L-lactate dehydrogenase complex protein LldF
LPEIKTQDFSAASIAAINDPKLRRALDRVASGFEVARLDRVAEATPEVWEDWRQQARDIKEHTIEHLDYYLDLLYTNVTAAGGHLHFAKDADQANEIVAHIAQTRGVKVATKSKSMVSEELGLNPVLEAVGVEVWETDLGEYIIQLAEETPSHLVAPALHKSKEDVAELFSEKLGIPYDEDIYHMAATAREVLRDKFMEADLGISGANFIVAETGTLVIITNEGNGRLSTSAPRIHIGITGMEKVIPSMQDLSIFLRLLPQSATGQRITSYVSMITGPRRSDDEDGPEEFHLVLVDNGRSNMLADPALREALYCIRCGACLNICPIYARVGGHAYGWVYPGPIGAVVTPMLVGLKRAKELPQASSLCGACREVCPIKIDIPRMLLDLRKKTAESPDKNLRSAPRIERVLASLYVRLMSGPKLLGMAIRFGRLLQKTERIIPFFSPMTKDGKWIRKAPLPLLSRWTRSRDLPTLPKQTFHDIWNKELSRDDS